MTLSEDEIALLGDNDDDWYGLWEVDWYFNGAHPDWSHKSRAEFLSGLVQRGLMEVFFGPLTIEQQPLQTDAALRIIADPTTWSPPADGQTTGYYISTSPTGIAALRPLTS